MINRELGIFVYMLCAAFLMQKLRFHSFLVSRLLLFSPPVEAIPASSATISLHFVGASDLIPRSEIFHYWRFVHLSLLPLQVLQ